MSGQATNPIYKGHYRHTTTTMGPQGFAIPIGPNFNTSQNRKLQYELGTNIVCVWCNSEQKTSACLVYVQEFLGTLCFSPQAEDMKYLQTIYLHFWNIILLFTKAFL